MSEEVKFVYVVLVRHGTSWEAFNTILAVFDSLDLAQGACHDKNKDMQARGLDPLNLSIGAYQLQSEGPAGA